MVSGKFAPEREFVVRPGEKVGDGAISVGAREKPTGRKRPDGLALDDDGGGVDGDKGSDGHGKITGIPRLY